MPPPLILAALTLTLSDTTNAQLRPRIEGGETVDLQTTGNAALTLTGKRSSFGLAYNPSVGVVDVTHDPQHTLFHGARATYSYSHNRLTLTLGVGGSIGRQSYLTVAGVAPAQDKPANPPATGAPGAAMMPGQAQNGTTTGYLVRRQVVNAGSANAAFGMTYVLTRRWSIAGNLGFVIGGGLGDSEEVLPKYYGPSAGATATYQLTRLDTLATSLNTSYTKVPTLGSRFVTSTLLETWGHRWSKRTATTLGVGVTHLRSRPNAEADYSDSILFAGNIGITHMRPLGENETLSLFASTGLTTPYNPVLGIVQQTLNEAAGVTWHKDRTTLGATATASQSLPLDSPTATRFVGLGATAGYRLAEYVGLQLGAAWFKQVLPAANAAADVPAQWLIFAGVALGAPPIEIW